MKLHKLPDFSKQFVTKRRKKQFLPLIKDNLKPLDDAYDKEQLNLNVIDDWSNDNATE